METNFRAQFAFVAILTVASLLMPLPLYLFSLALFGLPHIIWEVGFLKSRYAHRWSLGLWLALLGVLAIQAAYRIGAWMSSSMNEASGIIDILTLALLLLIVALAPARTGWLARIVGLIGAVAFILVLDYGYILIALLILSILHNFTPLAMVWDLRREHQQFRSLAWLLSGFFVLPILVAFSGVAHVLDFDIFRFYAPLLDSQFPRDWGGLYRNGILSAIVLSQCLHYYSVIYLLPHAEVARVGKPVISPTIRAFSILLVGVLVVYYMADYASARKLYAVASGAHAWVEWPILLMAFLSISQENRSIA